jgi:5-methylcytosine-specific restriction enzyme subunit McrC
MNQTVNEDNLRLLQDVVFILDEVEDMPFTSHAIDKIHLNTFFEDYSAILDICKLILNQQLYSSNAYNLSQWCLLFPMEYIFEDFIAGFIQEKFSNEWKIIPQESQKHLAKNSSGENVFRMRHDIFLSRKDDPEKQIIIDTKYKLRDKTSKRDDPKKKGIDQVDLYQMASYAFRRGCTDVILIYPNVSEPIFPFAECEPDIFTITSGFDITQIITIRAYEIPFWSVNNFRELPGNLEVTLREILNLG